MSPWLPLEFFAGIFFRNSFKYSLRKFPCGFFIFKGFFKKKWYNCFVKKTTRFVEEFHWEFHWKVSQEYVQKFFQGFIRRMQDYYSENLALFNIVIPAWIPSEISAGVPLGIPSGMHFFRNLSKNFCTASSMSLFRNIF